MTGECTLEIGRGGLVRLSGPLTFETGANLYHAVQDAITAGSNPRQIDLAGVSEIDSAGLALLLELQSVCQASGNTLSVSAAPDELLHLAGLCNAVELLNLTGRDE